MSSKGEDCRLPSPAMPKLSLFPYIWSDALAISIIVIVVGVSMGSLFAKKNNYAIDIRQVIRICYINYVPY